jgi:hypothetical protein
VQVAELKGREHQEITDLRTTVSTVAQHVQALTLENQALWSALEKDADLAGTLGPFADDGTVHQAVGFVCELGRRPVAG